MERTTERQACALLHMLEQLRQYLTECMAVGAGPGSVEHAHTQWMRSPSDSTESRGPS